MLNKKRTNLMILGMALFFWMFNFVNPTYALFQRPPQFIVFSFDNCTELERWNELTKFLNEMHQQGNQIHFTFFVSGTNFLTDLQKALYQGPYHNPGEAEIKFGGSSNDVKQRIQFINRLYQNGNEFASHAIGHFDATKWSSADYEQEFKKYFDLLNHVSKNNRFSNLIKLAYSPQEIVGFRAPYLSKNPNLYTTLKNHHFRYDASGIGNANEWPKKVNGIWHFNLVRLKIAGTNKKTISMDYNFMIAQSGEKAQSQYQDIYREQMLQTYNNYFQSNYNGNRAPIFIGHHFTNFQNGVYNQALLSFARKVCGLPEVQCITYKTLADFMDGLNPQTRHAYQKGEFIRAQMPLSIT